MASTRHVYRIYVKASVDVVFNALIDPAFTRQYLFGAAFELQPRQGEPFRTSMSDGTPTVDGTIEVLDPPHRLVMTWHMLVDTSLAEEPPSRVEWTLREAGDGLTQLDLVHGDLLRSPMTWAAVKDGWVWILDGLKTLIETGAPLPMPAEMPETVEDPEGQWHRAQAIDCNNSTWEMIEADRTPDNDEEMLRRAYASAYHWQRAAGARPANEARARWMLAKVHLLAGMPERSLYYADVCMAQCSEHGLVDFDVAYAYECRARALQALGRFAEAATEWAAAKAVPIADPEDQAILDGDLAEGP